MTLVDRSKHRILDFAQLRMNFNKRSKKLSPRSPRKLQNDLNMSWGTAQRSMQETLDEITTPKG